LPPWCPSTGRCSPPRRPATPTRSARTILLNSNRYSLTHWYQARGYHNQTADYYLNFKSTGEHRIRSAGSVAMALAVSLRLGIYDRRVVKVSRADAEDIALKLIRSLAARHRVNNGGFSAGATSGSRRCGPSTPVPPAG
jgi:hypothetical protein